VREVGMVNSVRDIADTVIKTQSGTPLHISDIGTVAQGPKIRLGQFGRAIRRENGKIVNNDDVFPESFSCGKARIQTTSSKESMPRWTS